MHSQKLLFALTLASAAVAQTLNIPSRVGTVTSLPSASIISGAQDMGNRDGATLSNVIIGANQLEGIHCKGKCTLKNVWFRDVCEDAITALGNGDVLIQGGGAQEAVDKVVQHNGRGTVTIKDFTVVNAGKLYRACGDCTNNGGPRNVVVQNVKAKGVSNLVGINSNYKDTASVSGSCGSSVKKVCQEFKGVEKGNGKSTGVDTTANCKGQLTLPAC